jgi:hypothetical protein
VGHDPRRGLLVIHRLERPDSKENQELKDGIAPQRVRDAHTSLVINTGDCFIDLWDMARTRGGLSSSRLVDAISEYGPHLRISDVAADGGLFLLEVCNADATEAVILQCVRELVETRGAIVNMRTTDPPVLHECAVRGGRPCGGWRLLVEYLLLADADAPLRALFG